ncbi:hypothetical protein ACB092_05G055100 [Castanea dentata]
MRWVNWGKVTRLKEVGGLGLQTAKGRNTALLAKLNWRLHTEGDALWARVLKAKYGTRQRTEARNKSSLPCSTTWRGIMKGEEVFKKGVKWIPDFESNLSFWFDCWTNLGPLRQVIHGPLTRESSHLRIRGVITPYGWDWSVIPFDLPTELKAEIQAIPTPIVARGGDKLAWSHSPRGSFSLSSTYSLAIEVPNEESFSGRWIWKLNAFPTIQNFVWKCMHNSIGVKECLVKRVVTQDPICPLCQVERESIIHALRDCERIKLIWVQLKFQTTNQVFFTQNTREWLVTNCN